jgi:hypothetical protein
MRVGDFVTVNRTTQPNGPKVPLHDHQRPLRLDLSRPTLVFDRSGADFTSFYAKYLVRVPYRTMAERSSDALW